MNSEQKETIKEIEIIIRDELSEKIESIRKYAKIIIFASGVLITISIIRIILTIKFMEL